MAAKGFLKAIIIKFIADKGKATGYEFMKYCKAKGLDVSPGTIYPHLRDLQSKGYLTVEEEGRRKFYRLTEEGKRIVETIRKSKEELEEIFKRLGFSVDQEKIPEYVKESLKGLFFSIKTVNWQTGKGLEELIKASEKLTEALRRCKDERHSS